MITWVAVLAVGQTAFADEKWLQGTEGVAVVKPWFRCPAVKHWVDERISNAEDEEVLRNHVEARRTPTGADLNTYEGGSGRDAYETDDTLRLDKDSCNGYAIELEGLRSTLYRGMDIVGFGDGMPPSSLQIVAGHIGAVVAKADDPKLAAARLVVQSVRDGGNEDAAAPEPIDQPR